MYSGLKFTQVALTRSQANKDEELSTSFSEAYGVTLKKYHSFVIKPIFALAMKACPYRVVRYSPSALASSLADFAWAVFPQTFYQKLGPPEADVDGQLQAWLAALEKIIAQIEGVYTAKN